MLCLLEVAFPNMRIRLVWSIFLLANFILCMNPPSFRVIASLSGNETDKLALLAFKDRISEDPLGVISSWNESLHFCDWIGVSCSRRHHGRVTVLNLQAQKLVGSIPPHIGNLTFLRLFFLGDNRFRGENPPEIGRLFRLQYLNLSHNDIEGEIPSNLSYCSALRGIDMNYNNLVGKIPDELSSLSKKLLSLLVSINNLTGSIPRWLGNASSLIHLSMADNNLQGSIPAELGKISNLMLLQIAGNNLSGTIPPPIYNLTSLLYLDVGDNQLHGRIPSNIGFTLPNLKGLYVGGNRFTGLIPVSLPNASGLVELDFSFNSFSGTVPLNLGSLGGLERLTFPKNQLETMEAEGLSFLTSLTNCSNLQALDIGQNSFKGKLPVSIANLSTSLETLIAGTNQISGTIPEGIENLIGLTRLIMSRNSITGEIPSGIGKLESLVDLRLSQNRISGAIPSSLGNLTQLNRLYLHQNNLDGNIPSSLGNCQHLEALYLFNNNLTGVIPKEVVSFSSLSLSFNLAQNSLTGPLPTEVGDMSHLLELDVSKNRLLGEIPSTIANCLMLESLLMGDNLFDGSIPSSFSTLKSLHFLDLSRNNLLGKIPEYLQNFTLLQNLDLSFNNLEGEVPHEGIFRNVNAVSIIGNRKLCGGIKELGLPACKIQGPKKEGRFLALKVVIPLIVSFLILSACFFVIFPRKRKSTSKPSTMSPMDEQFRKVSYAQLLQATNEFSSSNLIGEGSYGSVYKGILTGDGVTVAVKVLNLKQKGASKSFMAECEALRHIRHRNLIKIITTCSSIDAKGADFKALVYEFMPNGSLEEWLHRGEDIQHHLGDLSLTQRLNIAIDVAYAIEYLHHHCQTSIIHGDLKPSNVLLDQNMNAHVGDFGLARFLSKSSSNNSSQNQTSSIGIKGTIGYVAPEYGMGGKVSMLGDVYSFGILLLEMFTGRRPTDSMFTDGMTLHKFTKMALPERGMEIIEPSLLLEVRADSNEYVASSKEGRTRIEECLVAALRIGVYSSMECPTERMEMRDVVADMCTNREKFLGIRI